MSGMEDGVTGQGKNLLANRVEQRRGIPTGQIGPSDRTREHAVSHERGSVSLEHHPTG